MRRKPDNQNLDTEDIAAVNAQPDRTRAHDLPDPRVASEPTNGETTALFPDDELRHLRSQWSEIQAAFVDDPRHTVEEADHLVADAVQRLAATFAEQRKGLESQWARDEQVSTEDLRVALQRYRSFFDRLLTA
jgi:hypothetical protein